MLIFIFHIWNNVFPKTVSNLHPQKQRCEVGYIKMGIGVVGIKQVIQLLPPYWIYVCCKIQDITLLFEVVDCCVCVHI